MAEKMQAPSIPMAIYVADSSPAPESANDMDRLFTHEGPKISNWYGQAGIDSVARVKLLTKKLRGNKLVDLSIHNDHDVARARSALNSRRGGFPFELQDPYNQIFANDPEVMHLRFKGRAMDMCTFCPWCCPLFMPHALILCVPCFFVCMVCQENSFISSLHLSLRQQSLHVEYTPSTVQSDALRPCGCCSNLSTPADSFTIALNEKVTLEIAQKDSFTKQCAEPNFQYAEVLHVKYNGYLVAAFQSPSNVDEFIAAFERQKGAVMGSMQVIDPNVVKIHEGRVLMRSPDFVEEDVVRHLNGPDRNRAYEAWRTASTITIVVQG